MNKNDVTNILAREGYKYTEHGQIMNNKNSPVTNIIIIPNRQVRFIKNGMYEIYIVVSVVIDGDKEVDDIKLSASEVSNLKWIPSYLGMDAIIYPGQEKEFLLIIKKLFRYVETIEQHSNTGWVKSVSGEYEYLDYYGAIGEETIKVEMDEHFRNYKISRNEADVSLATQKSLDLLNVVDEGIAYILLGLVYLCPLLEFIGKVLKLPEFVVWLYGFTGTRKTTIGKLFLSHFGSFENRVTASFNDTYSSIELKSYKLKDSLMILDDFCPQQSHKETQNVNTVAEKIVRACGDRTSRGRLTVTMESQTQFIPRGMTLITGETIVPGNSTLARIVQVELKKDSVNLEALTEAQLNIESLSISMRNYILWIKKEVNSNYEEFLEAIKDNYYYYLNELRVNAISTHGRTYESFAWLLVGLDMMYQFYVEVGIITTKKADESIERAKLEFLDHIKMKHENSKEDNPVELFLETIKELITSKSVTMKNIETGEVVGNQYKSIDGFYDSEYYYFNSNNIYGVVRSKLQKAGVYLQLPIKGLLKALADVNVIKVEDKNNLPKKTIKNDDGSNSRPRMLHIKKEYLD